MDVKAPMIGKIIEIIVDTGGRVDVDGDLLIIESMKMEIPVAAPKSGTVREMRVAVGDTVQEGDVLLVLE